MPTPTRPLQLRRRQMQAAQARALNILPRHPPPPPRRMRRATLRVLQALAPLRQRAQQQQQTRAPAQSAAAASHAHQQTQRWPCTCGLVGLHGDASQAPAAHCEIQRPTQPPQSCDRLMRRCLGRQRGTGRHRKHDSDAWKRQHGGALGQIPHSARGPAVVRSCFEPGAPWVETGWWCG